MGSTGSKHEDLMRKGAAYPDASVPHDDAAYQIYERLQRGAELKGLILERTKSCVRTDEAYRYKGSPVWMLKDALRE